MESNAVSDAAVVVKTLQKLRIKVVSVEYDLQNEISNLLSDAGISFQKEYRLGKGSRVDFLTSSGVAIEVKKGKPNRLSVINQLQKYAEFDEVKSIILIIETSLTVPKEINGKPCVSVGLRKLWGIAI